VAECAAEGADDAACVAEDGEEAECDDGCVVVDEDAEPLGVDEHAASTEPASNSSVTGAAATARRPPRDRAGTELRSNECSDTVPSAPRPT
jgi:hypothetical protein